MARLYGDVRDLRAQAEVPVKEAQPATERAGKAPHDLGPNVVSLGSYRDRRKSRI